MGSGDEAQPSGAFGPRDIVTMQHVWVEPMAAPHRKTSLLLRPGQQLNLKDVAPLLGFDTEAPLRLQLANNTVTGIPMAGQLAVRWNLEDLRMLTGRAGCETAPFLLQGLPLDLAKSQEAARAKDAAKNGSAPATAAASAPPQQLMREAPPRKTSGRKRPAKPPRERLKDKSGQFTTEASVAAEAGASIAAPRETPSDERIQQLATVATDQQYTPQQEGVPGMPAQVPPGVDPTNPAQPLMPFDQPPPVPVPVQSKEQELAIMKERNDGLPLSKEESDDEVHPLPDAASGFRKRQKKIDHIPVRSSSIPGMTVGNVRKTLNQIRKAGNAIKSEHLLWNGWPAGRFALAYIKGHHEKRKQGKKNTDPDDEEGEEETGDEAPAPELVAPQQQPQQQQQLSPQQQAPH
ncbi:hypothetical protein WJX74_004602 [Apatococcus lobatus]|uniref:Uncharacterized protein n=2 Tax=Apatococcus TaxID=904362 RepID=A0AAW1SRT3_9CHLO